MKRRNLLQAGASAAGVAVLGAEAQAAPGARQVIELRRYQFASPQKLQAFEGFAGAAMAPALHRAGIRPPGVFKLMKADNPEATFPGEVSPELFLLLPHLSQASVAEAEAKLAADSEYASALAALGETPGEPAFTRFESSLLLGFDQCPAVETPAKAESRVLQLRIYESATMERGRMKVQMFNEGGEIGIFRRVGLNPVFFGHAFAGTRLPNLTYMLGFDSSEAMKEAWARFQRDPEWLKLRSDPKYRDTVSQITNLVLRPVRGSQI